MIKIKIEDNKVCIDGHSLPDICSAVSSVSTTIINCLCELCDEKEYEYELDNGHCVIEILQESDINKKLFNILITELKDIKEECPAGVKLL